MAGIDGIVNRIEAECRDECEKILAAAKAEAERIASVNAEQTARLTDEIAKKTEETAAQKERIARSNAALAVRRERLNARQELIARVFDEALNRLLTMDAAEYRKTVLGLIADCDITGGQTLRLSRNAAARLDGKTVIEDINAAVAPQKITLGEPTDEIAGGFLLESDRCRQICSFEGMIGQLRAALEPEIAAILFDEQ